MPVVTQVNWALAAAGREERLVRGRGYWYLFGGEATSFESSEIGGLVDPERAGATSIISAINDKFADRCRFSDKWKPVTIKRLWTVGDYVVTLFDAGGHPHGGGVTALYGVVEKAGPKAVTIRWESNLTNRVEQLRQGIRHLSQHEPRDAEDRQAALTAMYNMQQALARAESRRAAEANG